MSQRFSGRVVYLFAYDIAYDMDRAPLKKLLGEKATPFAWDLDKRAPRDMFFHRPDLVRLAPERWDGPRGEAEVERVVKVFPIGAVSVAFHVKFEDCTLDDLIAYHDYEHAYRESRVVTARVLDELRPRLTRPAHELRDEEAYTVFCLDWTEGRGPTEAWLASQRRSIAALLTQEPKGETLSDQEVMQSTSRAHSYYGYDLTVIDWDAALVVDRAAGFEPTLHVMELANVQLAEIETYDRMLDEQLHHAYHDLEKRNLKANREVSGAIRELRIDMARFSDELSNLTKFFGDWHLARIYESLVERFHIADWQRTIDRKLRTVDDLYGILKQDQMNRWMVILEATIVVLFIIDLALIAALEMH
ncbi:MAG: hypothetical protein ACF8PN_04550 [Phycisphaerales bacterium]